MSWATIVRSTPGAGLCGCERPDLAHQRGCLWQLDPRSRRKAALRRLGGAR